MNYWLIEGDVFIFRRVQRRWWCGGGGVLELSGGMGSLFLTKYFGGGLVAMLANGGHVSSLFPSGLAVNSLVAPEVKILA